MFILFVHYIEDRSKYNKINSRYTSVFKFCYYVIWLLFLPCFGAETEIIYILLVYICFLCQNTQRWLQQSHSSYVYINSTTKRHKINVTPTQRTPKDGEILGSDNRGELYLNSDVNQLDSGQLCKYTTVSSQFEWLTYPWTWHFCIYIFDIISKSALAFLVCYVQAIITTKRDHVTVEFNRFKKIHSRFFLIVVLQSISWQWVIEIVLFIFLWDSTKKGTLWSIFHWPTIILLS